MPAPFCAYVELSAQGGMQLYMFISQDSCDRWWRVCQGQSHSTQTTADEPAPYAKRFSPQFYRIRGLPGSFNQEFIILRASVLSMTGTPCIPPPGRADNLNRKAYYIRSRAKPDYFWTINFVQQLGRVALTNQGGPPKFIIQRANPLPYDCSPEEDILIGSDEVTITVILGDTQEAIVIGDSDNNTLQLGRNAPALKFEFGLLTSKGGFGVKPWATDIRFKSDGYGDEWELVN